jgi:hypothetical protein
VGGWVYPSLPPTHTLSLSLSIYAGQLITIAVSLRTN